MMKNDIIIRAEGLGYTYLDEGERRGDEIPALSGVTLSVRRGEYLAVLGHNGSGKSTLAKLLNLILTPTEGKLYIDGVDVSSGELSEDEVFSIRKKVGMVFQNPDNQLVATVVEEDVAFGPENLGLPREEIRARVDGALSLVGMTEYARHAPHKLSGGQKQRVAIAGIIAMRPEVIIFDESTAMLDPLGRRDLLDIMDRLCRDEGITVINITHYMDEAALADRVIVINDGETVLDGTPKEVFSEVDRLHAIGLEAPQGREILHLIGGRGIKVDKAALTEEECIAVLYELISRGNINE